MFLSHIDVSLSLPSSLAKKAMKKMSLGEDKEKKRKGRKAQESMPIQQTVGETMWKVGVDCNIRGKVTKSPGLYS